MQLDLFQDPVTTLTNELDTQRKMLENVRRGLFARHNELAKLVMALKEEIEEIKSRMGKKTEILDFFQDQRYG